MAGATLTAVSTENATSTTVDDDRFEIDDDGNLKLKDDMSLDFEGPDGGSVDVTITASGDGESATHTVTVTINDLNDEAPTIDVRDGEEVPQKGVTSSLTIDESVMGADIPPLALIEVMDADAADATTGQAGADMVTLSGDMADYFEVKLDPEDGLWLALKADASLDYETVGSSVMVTVTYTDGAGQSASADVTVTVNNVNEAAEVDGEVDDMAFVGGVANSMDVDLKALFMDPDGDVLSYSLSDNAPDWLELSVTTAGSGASQTITGTISGTPPAGAEGTVEGVSIVASDDDGAEANAMFDLIIDAENDAPDRLELRDVDEDGLVIRKTAVDIEENDDGAELGTIYLRDPDDARHPHGQHEFSFMVDGEDDDRFEVTADGTLKLKGDASLNYEQASTLVLTVTATDQGAEAGRLSKSLDITITVVNVDDGSSEGPVLVVDDEGNPAKVGPVTETVDENLDEDDVDAGDWLKVVPKGLSTAFEDPDGDTLTYSLGSGAPRWLQIDEDTGELTNKALMVPTRSDVYDVTIIASDDDGNTASVKIEIALAVADPDGSDNDEPDIRNADDIGYTEGDDGGVVATFEVRDDDIEIAPHPYGVHEVEFTAMQDPGDGSALIDVTHAFKIERTGDNGRDTADYEIHAKTAAELAMGADRDGDDDIDVYAEGHAKEGEVIPVDPIDYEAGDEIDFEVTVTDGADEADDRTISIDVENAADESPVFQPAETGGTRDDEEMTTTIEVEQDQGRDVLVFRLDELWDDADTDDDDLSFDVGGTDDLPDWIKVYGPDRWEDIYENRRYDVEPEDGDDVTGLRDRDEVVVIVVDRSTAPTNASLDGVSFTISADDGGGRMNSVTTETIMIDVVNENVNPADGDDAVSITGGDPNDDDEVTGTGNLTVNVNFDLDPDLAGGESTYLVLYTWMVSTGDDEDPNVDGDETMTTISVSASAQPLALGVPDTSAGAARGDMVRNPAYIDQTITAKVEVFEVDPATGLITLSWTGMADVDVASAATVTPPTPPTTVSFSDITTDTTGVVVTIAATGEAAEAGTARLQSSTNGTSGWINVDSTAADTTSAPAADLTLDVDADGNGTAGDGGGLYYRVVYVYEDEDGDEMEAASDVIKLGDVTTDPDNISLITATPVASGGTARVNSGTVNVEVQWQVGEDTDASGTIEFDEWMDLEDETGLTLTLTDDHAGKSVRARLTHKSDEDNPSYVTWVDYTDPATGTAVAALPVTPNNTPTRTQETYWIEVNLNDDDDEGTATDSVASLFFDADSDDLTYSLVGTAVDDGARGIQPGNLVYRSANDDQILTLDKDTGAITYYTSNGTVHDDDDTDTDSDGAGNWFTVTVESSDGKPDTADDTTDDVTINVRVNVAPTAINLNGTAIESDADATATVSGISLAETEDFDAATAGGTTSITLDVQDLNLNTHSYGSHTVTVDDDRFELERVTGNDMSQWTLSVKDGSEFDFEDDEADNQMGGLITLTVTATDKEGKSTVGYITVELTDVTDTSDDGEGNENTGDPQYEPPAGSGAGNGGVMTTGGSAGDDNAPGNGPGDGGLWIEEQHFIEVDLLEEFVISIDDIDIA